MQLPAGSQGILTPFQDRALRSLFTIRGAEAFVLFGGTALAEFYAGHRRSDDLDLFTFDREAVRPFAQAVELTLGDRLGAPGPLRQGVGAEYFQQLFVDHPSEGTLKIDIGLADPPQLDPVAVLDGVRVAGFTDLVAGKASALSDRALPRDGVDLWWIVERGGMPLADVERVMLVKDRGLADYPQAWPDALRRTASAPKAAWDQVVPMLSADVSIAEVRAFLDRAFEESVSRLAPAP
ncbi:MAG: nucleotidyl transferase AbiEii/AbiGii toxin family protein [Candidatus Dormibacteria bacterium]